MLSKERVIVSDISIIDKSPKVSPEIAKLISFNLRPEEVHFEISGVSNAVANGIRRTICGELPLMRMYAEWDDFTTTDRDVVPELVLKRLKMVPINQSIPADSVFELTASNSGEIIRDVKLSEIRILRGPKKLPFNDTATLMTLQPGASVKIKNIRMMTSYGFVNGDGMFTLGIHTTSEAMDQIPINTFEDNGGIRSSESNPRKWNIGFRTNGEMPAKALVALACSNLIARMTSVRMLLHTITQDADMYILVIPGESDTIGNLLMKTSADLYPDVTITYSTLTIGRECTVRIIYDDDINQVLNDVITHVIDVYTTIREFFV